MKKENAVVGGIVLLRAGTYISTPTYPCMHSFYECPGRITKIYDDAVKVCWANERVSMFVPQYLLEVQSTDLPLYFCVPLKTAATILYDYAMIDMKIYKALLNDIEANSINLVRATINNHCSLAEVYSSDTDKTMVKLIIRQSKNGKQGCKSIW